MSRVGRILLIVFRVVQLICSIIALGCGAYILYEMFSMASSARHMEATIDYLQNATVRSDIESTLDISNDSIDDFSTVLQKTLVPVLHHLEGTPTRALIVAIAGLWSTGVIVYMLVVNRKSSKPGLNRRSVRVPLELVTLVLWIASSICAVLLALEYGFIVLAGGTETKLAFDGLKPLIQKALEQWFRDDSIVRDLSIIDEVVTIGALSILSVAASCICLTISLVSSFIACCYSGKQRPKATRLDARSHSEATETFISANNTEKQAGYSVINMSTPSSTASPWTPPPPIHTDRRSAGYTAMDISPPWTPPPMHHHSQQIFNDRQPMMAYSNHLSAYNDSHNPPSHPVNGYYYPVCHEPVYQDNSNNNNNNNHGYYFQAM